MDMSKVKVEKKEKPNIHELVNKSSKSACIKIYQSKAEGKCSFCGENVIDMENHVMKFERKISRVEYNVSALCEACQRDFFGY